MQHIGLDQQFFLARSGAVDVDRRVDALLVHAPVEMDFHIAGALEFFVDHIVHSRAGVDERGRKDSEAAALLDIARRAEETLGALQRVRIHAAGQNLARSRHYGIVGARQARYRVKQDYHVLFMFDKAFCFFQHHLRHLHVARRRLIESGGDYFALDRTLHFRHLFRPLVNQQHDQHALGKIRRDRVRDMLEHHCLAGLGRRYDQPALPLADRRNDVNYAAGDVFFRLDITLQDEWRARKQRCQVFEQDFVLGVFRRLKVDLVHFDQREIAFAVLGSADFPLDRIPGVQVEAAYLAGTDVNVIGPGEIRSIGRTQKAEAVGQDFQSAFAENAFALARLVFEEGKNQFLLAQAIGALYFIGDGHVHQFGDMEVFKFG